MDDTAANNRRIAKNTLVLYIRMLFLMVISLYTSRVVLNKDFLSFHAKIRKPIYFSSFQ